MVSGFWRTLSLVIGWFIMILIFLPSLVLPFTINTFSEQKTDMTYFYVASGLIFLVSAIFLWLGYRKPKKSYHQI